MSGYGKQGGSPRLLDAVADSAPRTATALAALAGAAALHPLAGVAALACGAGLIARRSRRLRRKGRRYALRLGSAIRSGKPVELSRTDACRGVMVSGTVGSGRTAFLLGLSERSVGAGSGLLYVDGTGDPGMLAKVSAMARKHGREDDLLVLDMTLAGNAGGRTHTFNPLASGSVPGTVQALADVLTCEGGDGAMWKGRAVALLLGLVGALAWMRDERGCRPDLTGLRERFPLREVIGLSDGSSEPGLPQEVRQQLDHYLSCLPGYDPALGQEQPESVRDQHGYLEMVLETSLGRLARLYAPFLRAGIPDVAMRDVVLNRRILLVLLPSLERCNDEASDPAKVVVSALKQAMLEAVSDGPGSHAFASDLPFLSVLDEYGYYAVDGFGLVAQMAGRHGFSTVYAADCLPALRRMNEAEGTSVAGRTATKVFMRAEDVVTTSGRRPTAGGHVGPEPTESELMGLASGEGIVVSGGGKAKARLVRFDMPLARKSPRQDWVSGLLALPGNSPEREAGR